MSLDDAPEVLTVAEAAKLLRRGRNQLYEDIRRGEVPALRLGRSLRIPKAALARLLDVESSQAADSPRTEGGTTASP